MPHGMRILVPQPGIESVPPAVKHSLNHWTAREVPVKSFKFNFLVCFNAVVNELNTDIFL